MIHCFSDGFGAGEPFPMWPQIIDASCADVINYSETSISNTELLSKFLTVYNSDDFFIVQVTAPGRIVGTRKPACTNPLLISTDKDLLDKVLDISGPNVFFASVYDIHWTDSITRFDTVDMNWYSNMFDDRGDEVQPQPVVHARWLNEFLPQYIDNTLYNRIEEYGQWIPYHWDRNKTWEQIKNQT